MKRDEEISRLTRYAQGMGLSVRFKPYVPGSGVEAEWRIDGTEIIIYTDRRSSKLAKVLSLIHEISHHKAWIDNNRALDPKIEEAIDSEENSKKQLKRLWDMETQDSAYWEDIYRDTNCTFPIERLHKQREFDLWCYEFHYENGRTAKTSEKKNRWKELNKKYG